MTFTEEEMKVLRVLIFKMAKEQGEDVIGLILYNTGHQILDDQGVVDLASKIEGT
jgi:hypothetical protein